MNSDNEKNQDGTKPSVDAEILLVEDDPDDVMIIKRAIACAPIIVRTREFRNGREALDYLNAAADDNRLGDISLVLLDLNLPLMDGHEFLRHVRGDGRFGALPVVVLTTSTEPDVIQKAYKDGANAVISKVDTLEGMMNVVDTIVRFWFQTAQRFLLG